MVKEKKIYIYIYKSALGRSLSTPPSYWARLPFSSHSNQTSLAGDALDIHALTPTASKLNATDISEPQNLSQILDI